MGVAVICKYSRKTICSTCLGKLSKLKTGKIWETFLTSPDPPLPSVWIFFFFFFKVQNHRTCLKSFFFTNPHIPHLPKSISVVENEFTQTWALQRLAMSIIAWSTAAPLPTINTWNNSASFGHLIVQLNRRAKDEH